MATGRPADPGWTAVVRAHQASTVGLVVATSGACLRIQRDEAALVTGRVFRPIHPRELSRLDVGPRWYMGVLLCPGDTTEEVVRWAKTLPRIELQRIRFYAVKNVDFAVALEAWATAGLPDLPRFRVAGFRSFHKLLGRHHADRVYIDATRKPAA